MKIPILQVGNVLLASLQDDLTDRDLQEMQVSLLETIGGVEAFGVVIDVSALETVDSYIVRMLSETATMAGLLGCFVVVAGIRSTVAISLVEMEQQTSGFGRRQSLPRCGRCRYHLLRGLWPDELELDRQHNPDVRAALHLGRKRRW